MKKAIMTLMSGFIGLSLTSAVQAAPLPGSVAISSDITTDTILSADNVYHLTAPIFVRNGASLTIPAGTVIATDPADDGGLVVTRDSQLFILGTPDNPVIMTTTADVATWDADPTHPTGKNPKTGTWRETANEWRNLTILGNGVISASEFGGSPIGPKINPTCGDPGAGAPFTACYHNPQVVDGSAQKNMEGLTASDPGSGDVNDIRYGGADDTDDSGTIRYLSIRYTGRVLGAGDELNGLSLGGIGSGTDITGVEIMNNVDDGIEIWGGKVCLNKFSIWNIGDDSLDFDQGWRGQAQYGLIVQGYALDASQGSGTGDNLVEHDGGEQADVQPTSTASLSNLTIIGEPTSGDGATTWRDNANVQYRKTLFIDFGEELVRLDNVDGDGGTGYGTGGTLSFLDRWSTAYNTYPTVNAGSGAFASNASFYSAQSSGTLAEISDSVVYHYDPANQWPAGVDGDDEASNVGAFPGFGSSGAPLNNVVASVAPIKSLTRSAQALKGGKLWTRVVSLDPLPANDGLVAQNTVPTSGCCIEQTNFRGAFSPNKNWLKGWSASDAFGFIAGDDPVNVSLTASVAFETQDGVLYQIEESCDGVNFDPIAVVEGDGSVMNYSDLEDFDSSKVYQVNVITPTAI
jgi:hypothetical protein